MTRKPPKVSDKERFFNKFSNDKEAMAIVDYLEKTKEPVTFIHGKAGTGKSIFLQSYYDYAESKGDNIIKLAPTGLAARNIEGQTISSFFGFDWRPLKRNDPSIYKQRISLKPMIQTVDTIIIDEISMVRSDLIDAIDTSLRHNSKQKNKPFGGKRIIFFGDIFQLEPVLEKKEEELFTDFGYDHKDFFFFKAKVFKEYSIDIEIRELTKAYRHNQDKEFLDILDKIRIGNDTDLEKINSRIQKTNNKDSLKQTTLCTKTKIADKYNNENLSRLPGDLFKNTGIVKDNYPEKELPTEEELAVKIEAKVIFVKNDSLGRWVNGSIGYISNVQKESKSTSLKSISVKLEDDNKEVIVRPVVFENMRYYFDEESKSILSEIEGTFTQFPIKLGWALTIHKSQGLEFKNIAIDRGTGMFAHGQLYVALSRCQSLKGIKLKSKIKKSDVVVKPSAINFINQNKSEKIKEDWRPIDLYGDEDEPQINNNNEEGGDFVLSEEYEVLSDELNKETIEEEKQIKLKALKIFEKEWDDKFMNYRLTDNIKWGDKDSKVIYCEYRIDGFSKTDAFLYTFKKEFGSLRIEHDLWNYYRARYSQYRMSGLSTKKAYRKLAIKYTNINNEKEDSKEEMLDELINSKYTGDLIGSIIIGTIGGLLMFTAEVSFQSFFSGFILWFLMGLFISFYRS